MALSSDLDPIFDAAAKEWNVDPRLLRAVATQESAGNPKAVSSKGARGLMGIMPDTGQGLGMTDLADPVQSIYGGAKYLNEALTAEKTPAEALLYYHGGPDWRSKMGPESMGYVPAVTAHYQKLAPKAEKPTTAGGGSVLPSDDDFLAATAPKAGARPAAGDDDAAFLSRTGAKVPPTKAPEPPPQSLEDVISSPAAVAADVPRAPVNAAGATGRVAGEAYEGAKQGLLQGGSSGEVTNLLQRAGVLPPAAGGGSAMQNVNAAMWNPLSAGGDLALRGMNALMGGYQRGVAQAGEEAGMPGLGRELAALPEAFPTGDAAGGGVRLPARAGVAPRPNLLELGAIDRPYLPPAFQDAPLGPGAAERITARQAELGPVAGPRSAGAAASRDMSPPGQIEMTPRETIAHRSVAEGQKLNEPQPLGADTSRYVQGVEPTEAHLEQKANVSREQKTLESAIPEEFKAQASRNNEARKAHFEQLAGSDVTVDAAKARRGEQAEADLKATWANKQPADAQPVLDAASEILGGEDGKRPAVRAAVNSILGELKDKAGNLETDPALLYGVRKHIGDMLSREGRQESPLSSRAEASMLQLRTALDGAIEAAAPGFRQYLDNYAAASRPIEEMEALQKHENGIHDSQGRIQLSRVQSMMRQIVDARSAPGINPYQSISDATMAQLWNLRDDLRRVAASDELARARGSDTAQNMMDLAKSTGRLGVSAAAHGVANFIAPVAGSFVVNRLSEGVRAASDRRAAARMQRRAAEMARPDPSKYPARNLLDQP